MKAILTSKIFLIIVSSVVVVSSVVTAVAVVNSKDVYRLLKIFEISGSAVVARDTVGDIDAYQGMNLESGDSVNVDGSSYMRIQADEDKYILAEPGSDFDIETYGNEKDNKTVINLRSGAILNEINKKLSEDSTYEVNTPKATMAVRGTSFRIAVEKGEDGCYYAIVQTFDGAVKVQLLDESGNPKGEPVEVAANSSAAIKVESNPEGNADPSVNGIANFIIVSDEEGSNTFPIDPDMVPKIVAQMLIDSSENGDRSFSEEMLQTLTDSSRDTSAQPGYTNMSFSNDNNGAEGGNTDGGNNDGDNTSGSNNDTGNTTSGNTTGINTSSSNTDGDNTDVDNTDSGNNDTGNDGENSDDVNTKTGEDNQTSSNITTSTKAPETSDNKNKSYSVNFYGYDNELLNTQTVKDGEAAHPPKNPTKKGYVFVKWDKDFSSVHSDMDIKAEFEQSNSFTVTFKGRNGTTIDTQEVEKGKSAVAPSAPEEIGYTFVRWDTNFSSVQSDLTVKAIYDQKKYTVTFKGRTGNIITTQQVLFGNSAYSPSVPDEVGYEFVRWDNYFSYVQSDLIVTAIYNQKSYTVTFKGRTGNTISTQQVSFGNSASAPVPPQEPEYVFTGWDVGFSSVQSDLTVTALYVQNTYTVTFIDEYNVTSTTIKGVPKGTNLAGYSGIPGNPSLGLWGTFKGWQGRTADANFNNVTGNITLYAEYDKTLPVKFVLRTYVSDSGTTYQQDSVISAISKRIGSTISFVDIPEKFQEPDEPGTYYIYFYNESPLDSDIEVNEDLWRTHYSSKQALTIYIMKKEWS